MEYLSFLVIRLRKTNLGCLKNQRFTQITLLVDARDAGFYRIKLTQYNKTASRNDMQALYKSTRPYSVSKLVANWKAQELFSFALNFTEYLNWFQVKCPIEPNDIWLNIVWFLLSKLLHEIHNLANFLFICLARFFEFNQQKVFVVAVNSPKGHRNS